MKLKAERQKDLMEYQQSYLRFIGERVKNGLVEVCKNKYETGKWPDDFTKAIIVTIEKKINAS